ncbi:pseudomurein-binding repeat-containing protein [Methanothermobacter sp. K4]|uniref:pseudomurein-binding repeat-containing protein n=1 Tax=Methanothermobacter sp. K4 TaxID=2913262 RepID=UPI001EDAB3AF|nr:pseudomurein-binding repeat-containing protein [Methanothermobacter sp. K4]MCG2829207.1 hypothetical protein [Methanothermobacter sp. K4]
MIKHLFAVAAIVALLILSGTASAADIYVNATGGSDDNDGLSWAAAKATIGNATMSAASGDSIWLADGEYRGAGNRDVLIDRNLTITGQSTTGTVIDCEALGRAFTVPQGVSFTLRNLTVKHGNEDYGGVILNHGNLTVGGCSFIENMGLYGAVITNNGTSSNYAVARISNSHFENNSFNSPNFIGGALCSLQYTSMVVESCTFINNSVTNSGGAISSMGESNLTVRDSVFTKNGAGAGGAIYSESGNAEIMNCTFTSNSATYGGAIHNYLTSGQWNMTVCSSDFTSNTGYMGGAISSCGNIYINSATFHDNGASQTGGAIYVYGYRASDSAEIVNCTFTSNSATFGGAVATDQTRTLRVLLRGSTFSGNTAWYGGGFLASGVNATVSGCNFSENVASAHGGGIRNDYGNLTVRNTTFTGNRAFYAGGGISNVRAALADITESTFTGNVAESWNTGSAVLSYLTVTVINFCRILDNPGADVFCEAGPGVDARFNWWGNNSPDFSELTSGDVTANPWIVLTITANPGNVPVGSTSLIRADLLHDSAGTLHTTAVPYTGVVDFSTTYGTISDAVMSGGVASSTLRNLNAPGVAVVSAVLDNQMVNTTVTVRAAPAATGITINQLVAAAVNVRNHYLRYRKLPSSVTIASKGYSMAQFLDLLARATVQLNSGNQNPLKPRTVGYAGSIGIWRSGKLSRQAYVSVAASIRNFINSQGRAPRYASTVYGRVSFVGLVYSYSEVLRFYGNNRRLPNYLII